MRSAQLSLIILSVLLLFFGFSLFTRSNKAQAVAGHVVISEIQIAGVSSSTDEFVELYNPTGTDMNLNNWELTKKTESGTESILVATISGTIKSHGFFLITHPTDYTGSISADMTYSTGNSIAPNNTVILYSDDGITSVDLVGFGNATASEGATTANPASGKSKERKANSLSDSGSMSIGGADELEGNGEDTDNNNSDFVLRDNPQPQNSASSVEPVLPTPSETPSPTLSPTVIPTETQTPTPSETPTPTETLNPTDTPIPTETITPTSTPTVTLTLTPTPTGIIHQFPFPTFTLVCTWNFKTFSIFGNHFVMPYFRCVFEKI